MPSDLQNLLARKAAITAELASLSSTANGGKPSYSIDGQHVRHTEYKLSLYEELKMIDQLIVAAEGPFEERGRGVT